MPINAHLLGPPLMVRDGVVYAPPKGKKVWALFAYLVLSESRPTRPQLIDLLFPHAEDPAGALRWNLSELRRLLGGPDTVGSGNTVQLRVPDGSVIDVEVLMRGTSLEAVALPGLGRELLEGIEINASPGFAAWLLGERRRLQALGEAVLREGALQALANDDPRSAVELATRLIAVDALNEDAHALLIRAFAGTGDAVAVQRQLDASIDLFRRELGIERGPELVRAAGMEAFSSSPAARGPAGLRALIESGEAAVNAGAIAPGVDHLHQAVVASKQADETEREAEALLALGSALVHAVKGRDEEGAAALHRCIALARTTGQRTLAAAAHRELGYIDVLRGDYVRAQTWLRAAETLAEPGSPERASIGPVRGTCLADVGAHDAAMDELRYSVGLAESNGQSREQAWCRTVMGRTHLLRNELDLAEAELERARALATNERWTAFMPFPEALSAEAWVRQGDLDRATEMFEHAYALGCQVDDACWESYGARGFGIIQAARGDLSGSVETIEAASSRCARQPDMHRWLRAYVLDALCAVAVAARHPNAGRWIADLSSLAGHAGMRELSVRAYLHRRDLGDGSAVDAARALSSGVENPHLSALIDVNGPPLLDDLLGKVRSP